MITVVKGQALGVLAAEEIAGMIDAGAISLAQALRPRQLQPASLDLTLGRRAWRVRASFLPPPGEGVAERLRRLATHELDLSHGAVLERGCVYLVELNESLRLPADVAAAANPKSSTGRLDVFVRLVADGGAAFDEAPAGYCGGLFAEISPRTFSVLARAGTALNQIRFKRGAARLSDAELRALHKDSPLVDGAVDVDGGLGLSVDLEREPFVGWRARRHAGVIDLDAPCALDAEDFFEPLQRPKDGLLILDPDEFYILASKECLTIPPDYAAEMAPISPGLGEFRVHYAGFFDPGFGWAEGAPAASRAVLEVRSRDAPFALGHGQLVARLVYERMATRPRQLYGDGVRSNYQGQGLKLSKHFREPSP